MKKSAGLIALLLILTLFAGCLPANGAETFPPASSAPSRIPVLTAPPAPVTETAGPETTGPETTQTAEAAPGFEHIVMELTDGLTATPDEPTVNLTVSFPAAESNGAGEGPGCRLTVEVDGVLCYERSALRLHPDAEETFPLSFSFARYQPDRTAKVVVTLTCGSLVLRKRTGVRLQNDPDEVYAARSGDARPYSIDVIRSQNVVIVYGRDDTGAYTVPVKVWLCSTGRATPSGYYRLGSKKAWGLLFGGVYGQYVCGISGNILFHSVPYTRMDKGRLKTEEYNKLGTAASMGCVRLAAGDAWWIYEYCPVGTPIHIYDAQTLPVQRPVLRPIDLDDPRACWDPTDPDEANPWNR